MGKSEIDCFPRAIIPVNTEHKTYTDIKAQGTCTSRTEKGERYTDNGEYHKTHTDIYNNLGGYHGSNTVARKLCGKVPCFLAGFNHFITDKEKQ